MKAARAMAALLLVASWGLAETPDATRVRRIILRTGRTGANRSAALRELSRKLSAADIPVLVELTADREITVGAQFGLASQCQAAIEPVREAAMQKKMEFLDASDALHLVETFEGCAEDVRRRAADTRAELAEWQEKEWARQEAEYKRREEEDARIQANGLKMLDRAQAKSLTPAEREEVYHRSLKAMGIDENRPMTPAQKDLVQRMYRTMVLGESTPQPNQ